MCTGCSSKFGIVNIQNLLGHPVYEKERKLKMQSNEAPLLCFLLSCISTFLVGGKLAKGKRRKQQRGFLVKRHRSEKRASSSLQNTAKLSKMLAAFQMHTPPPTSQ